MAASSLYWLQITFSHGETTMGFLSVVASGSGVNRDFPTTCCHWERSHHHAASNPKAAWWPLPWWQQQMAGGVTTDHHLPLPRARPLPLCFLWIRGSIVAAASISNAEREGLTQRWLMYTGGAGAEPVLFSVCCCQQSIRGRTAGMAFLSRGSGRLDWFSTGFCRQEVLAESLWRASASFPTYIQGQKGREVSIDSPQLSPKQPNQDPQCPIGERDPRYFNALWDNSFGVRLIKMN